MKIKIIVTTGLFALALLTGCDKPAEQGAEVKTSETAVAETVAPAVVEAPAVTSAPEATPVPSEPATQDAPALVPVPTPN